MNEPQSGDVTVTSPETSAAGIPAVAVSIKRTVAQAGVRASLRSLLEINQVDGYDCPGCAWPDEAPDDRKRIAFCENGVKAVAEEAMSEHLDRRFFETHSVEELRQQSDFWLGRAGRLTEPLLKPAGGTHFEPVDWDTAYRVAADALTDLDSADEAVFYTSGRASNEAAYVYQLLARSFGTNNLPDCSNMCHEPTSVALAKTIGIGKGTVRLDDLHAADLVIVAGQNPGTNHPRMLSALERTKRNGGNIIAINPLPEAGLLRFKNPQRPRGIVGDGVEIADLHLPIRLGADQALFQLWNRWLLDDDAAQGDVIDRSFIARYTSGFDDMAQHLAGVDPESLLAATGLDRADVRRAYEMIKGAGRVIICWAMGITQHLGATGTIDEIVNLALLGGHIGRPGAGLCPVRGHSNVQGDRTVGVWEHAEPEFIDALDAEFGLALPRVDGHNTVDTVAAFRDGRARVFVSLGGNFLRATPDTTATEDAFRNALLTVNLSTKLNRSQLVTEGASLVLPVRGRTERDDQNGVEQFISVEDSMSMVHASTGSLQPPSAHCDSEVAIICNLARHVLGDHHPVGWQRLGADYDLIRDHIANTVDGFADYNRRVREPGGFELPNPPRDSRTFTTETGTANFSVTTFRPPDSGPSELLLQTLRSHDQYNTTIYGHDDRYRGIAGDRHVIMLNPVDIERLGFSDGDVVDIVATIDESTERRARRFRIVSYPTPAGSAAAYYPETNVLIPLDHHDAASGTPASKSIAIRLERPASTSG